MRFAEKLKQAVFMGKCHSKSMQYENDVTFINYP